VSDTTLKDFVVVGSAFWRLLSLKLAPLCAQDHSSHIWEHPNVSCGCLVRYKVFPLLFTNPFTEEMSFSRNSLVSCHKAADDPSKAEKTCQNVVTPNDADLQDS
jgi:hypothetical protein